MNKNKTTVLSNKPFAGRPFLLVLFLAIEIFIVLYFLNDYRKRDNLYKEQALLSFEAGYRGATSSYDQAVQMIFDDVVNKPEVLRLIALALDDDKKRDDCRNELYRLILASYEKQKAIGILQVHFHLNDGTSLLRMHAPEKYGDNLFRRMAVYQVNKEKRPVKGYEVGYFADGYRFMYPLFYNSRHVGSIEFGLTAEGIIKHLNHIYPAHYAFIINRPIVDNMTYADWKKRNYRESGLSDDFMIRQEAVEDAIVASINQKLRDKVRDRLAGMERFVEKESGDGRDYLIKFLPVRDVKGDAVAYFVQYMSDKLLAHHLRLTIIDITLFTLLLAAIFYSIDNIQSRRKSLEQKNAELENISNELQQYKLLSQHARDIILFIGIDGRIIEANEAAQKAYGYSRDDLCSLNIANLRARDTLHSIEAQMNRANEQGFLFETVHQRRDGSTFPVEVSSVGVDIRDQRVLLSIIRDITERRNAEEKLHWINDLMKYVISHAQSAIAVHDRDMKYIYVSDQYLSQYNVREKDVIGKHHYDVFPDLPQKWRDVHQRVLAGAVESADEDPYFREDGSVDWTRWECRPWYESDGSIGGLIVYTEVITERVHREEALRASEERFRSIVSTSQEWIWAIDLAGIHTYSNPAIEHILGYHPDEISGRGSLHLLHEEDIPKVEQLLGRCMKQKTGWSNLVLRWKHRDGSWRYLESNAVPILDRNGVLVGFQGADRDITDRKKAEEALRESEVIFRSFMEYSPIYVFFKDEHIRSLRLSRNFETMLERPIDELLGKSMDDLFPSDLAKSMIKDDMLIMKEGKTVTVEEEFNSRVYYTIKFPIHIDGKPRYLAGYTIDITDRRNDEIKIKKALTEKETLLREIHHRVKNNMQVIISLLKLQAQRIQDKDLKKPFEESEQRIRAMAMVHERLYQKNDLSGINFSEYIHNIISELKTAYHIDGRKVAVKINVEDIVLEVDSAIPCGLIINELITNCFKYAFPEGRRGEVIVNFTKEGNTYNMTIRDNGVGLPVGFDHRQTTTLGLQLVNVLTKQLLGNFQIRTDRGTEAAIAFTIKERVNGKEKNTDS